MITAILHGAAGRMGHMTAEIAAGRDDIKIIAGVDAIPCEYADFPCYTSLDAASEADVVIDFSTAAAMDNLFKYCLGKKTALVLCTTGLSDAQLSAAQDLSKVVPVLRSGNMSLGINTLIKILGQVTAKLSSAGFDIEIEERHHNKKLDAPSGTALMLADAANDAAGGGFEYVYDRTSRRKVRPSKEIGISAIRGGSIVGEHDVIFAGPDEIIEIKHTALSRAVFANGAIGAALYIAGKAPGLYTMSDVVG